MDESKEMTKINITNPPQGGSGVPTLSYTSDIEGLIAKAIDKGTPVETMEKLLAMRRELKAEQAKEAFFRDLAGFQAECPVIKKNKEVLNKDKKSVRYHYAPLDDIVEQVKEYLQKYGFSYTIQTVYEKDPPAIVSVLSVHHIEGHSRDSEFRVPIGSSEYMTEQQAHASASTFSKRYVFQNGFGILTADEDNDARSANGNDNKQPVKQEEKRPWKSVEYIKMENQILEDIDADVFTGKIELDGESYDLDRVAIQLKKDLSDNFFKDGLSKVYDKIARMTLIAEGRDAVNVDSMAVETLSDNGLKEDIKQELFDGIVDNVKKEGDLSE